MKLCITTALRIVQGTIMSTTVATSSVGAASDRGLKRGLAVHTAAISGRIIRIAFSCVSVARPVSTPAAATQASCVLVLSARRTRRPAYTAARTSDGEQVLGDQDS